jgi:hypothetical protein
MEIHTLIAFVLGISASIYLIASAMSRIISRRNNDNIEKKLDLIQHKLENLSKLGS